MSDRPIRVLLAGVGGQGVLTAAHVLGNAAVATNTRVTIGQLHGMAQRGGGVESTVVFGPARTAFIGHGEADLVLGFEPLELLRALPTMSARTHVVMNRDRITPFNMTLSDTPYPDLGEIEARIRSVSPQLTVLDATEVARRAGDKRAIGTVLLGVAAHLGVLPFNEQILREAMELDCPASALAANRRAFVLGADAHVAVNTL